MLPDLKKVKRELQQFHIARISELAHAKIGVFGVIPKHMIHEGDSLRTLRADGSVEESRMLSAQAESLIALEDIPRMTPDQREAVLEGLAEEMAKQMSAGLFASLDEVLNETGQVVTTSEFGPDAIFDMLEKVEIQFDENGAMKNMCITGGSEAIAKWKKALADIHENEELRGRYESLMNKKLERWRDQEASRKLVG